MNLKTNEFTISGLVEYLNKKLGSKSSGEKFNSNDVAQYRIKGYIPYKYGGNIISEQKTQNVVIITLHPPQVQSLFTKEKNSIEKNRNGQKRSKR